MKAVRTRSFLCALLLGAVALSTTGCLSGVKEPYSLEERIPVMEDSLSRTVRYADGFASDLCVVEDEYSFDESYVTSEAAALFDVSDRETLYSKEAFERLYPASITKVMTALLVFEAIDRGELSQDQMITVSSTSQFDLSADGSTANLKPGEVISVKDLMYCLLLPSANEAANILAEAVCGDVASFIELMNQRARELGCTGTHFANTHGLHDDDHYTTAYDICLFTREALKHDLIREVVGTSVYTVPATNLSEPREFYNTNALLSNWHYMGYVYDKAIGVWYHAGGGTLPGLCRRGRG